MNSIIVADSHTMCREALCDYMRHADPDLHVECAHDCHTLKEVARRVKAEIILIEQNLPGMENGLIPEEVSFSRIGILACGPLPEGMRDLEDIQGIFPKSLSCKAMMAGVQDILKGRTFFPDIGGLEPDDMHDGFRRPPEDFNLTAREREVLSFLIRGASNKDIARTLDLQVVTVKLHVRGICRKLRAANRTQAALIAVENGWGA